jgi:hypothetical protein
MCPVRAMGCTASGSDPGSLRIGHVYGGAGQSEQIVGFSSRPHPGTSDSSVSAQTSRQDREAALAAARFSFAELQVQQPELVDTNHPPVGWQVVVVIEDH